MGHGINRRTRRLKPENNPLLSYKIFRQIQTLRSYLSTSSTSLIIIYAETHHLLSVSICSLCQHTNTNTDATQCQSTRVKNDIHIYQITRWGGSLNVIYICICILPDHSTSEDKIIIIITYLICHTRWKYGYMIKLKRQYQCPVNHQTSPEHNFDYLLFLHSDPGN
jgi:hypothetical protein